MKWYELEKQGWSWCVGYSQTRQSYYAQAWRDFPTDKQGKIKPKLVNGHWVFRDCVSEHGDSIDEAKSKLFQRLEEII